VFGVRKREADSFIRTDSVAAKRQGRPKTETKLRTRDKRKHHPQKRLLQSDDGVRGRKNFGTLGEPVSH